MVNPILNSREGRTLRIEHLYRYPVKGLTAEALDDADVRPGGALPWDRAFALAQGDAAFDPERPEWLAKSNFMCLLRNARIAALRASFDPQRSVLMLRTPDGQALAENPFLPASRARIGAFLTQFLGPEARGEPRFHYVPGHVFCDQRRPVISLINLASLASFEAALGARRELMRFRANVYFSGAAPWREFGWVGEHLQVGGARLLVTKRIVRCAATEVNPATAERDAEPVRELRTLFGHSDLGIHAEVLEGGRISLGDSIESLP